MIKKTLPYLLAQSSTSRNSGAVLQVASRTVFQTGSMMIAKAAYQQASESNIFQGSHMLYSTGSQGGSNGGGSNGSNGGSGGSQGGKAAAGETDKKQTYFCKQERIKVNEYIDQTVLKAGTRWEDVKKICNEALGHDFAAVCIPPAFVPQARDYLRGSKVKIATVIGFPFGNTTTEVKVFETRQAIENGAHEIDMVINIGWLKSGDYDAVGREIKLIKEACGPHGILKVIVETGLLTEDEISKVTVVVDKAGADYIKTSTGFGPRGASLRDVELFKENSSRLKIKAAGGVRDNESAEKYIRMGVSRIGTSTGTVLLEPAKGAPAQKQPGSY